MKYSYSCLYDLAFIGSGVSTTFTLLKLIDKLKNEQNLNKKINIIILEKNDEFWKGLPYGKQSSLNSLILTPLCEFVLKEEKDPFIDWLEKNKKEWMEFYLYKGNSLSKTWLQHNFYLIENNIWDKMYLPRFLYGDYLSQKIIKNIETLHKCSNIQIDLFQGNVYDVIKKEQNDYYQLSIKVENAISKTILAKKVVLSIGSPPIKKFPILDKLISSRNLMLDNIYSPDLDTNYNLINRYLSCVNYYKRNVLIIGSNASTMELLYLLNHNHEVVNFINKITIISTSGFLPYPISHSNINDDFTQFFLLKNDLNNAFDLFIAIKNEIKLILSKNVSIGDIYPKLNNSISECIENLEETEQYIFHLNYGLQLSKLIRRSGHEYSNSAKNLMTNGKVQLMKCDDANLLDLKRMNLLFNQYPVIVNCSGFENLHKTTSPILSSLIRQKICKVNATGKGIMVNKNFEANKNLYVFGPLLGGNFNKNIRFWHLENARNICSLANHFSNTLERSLILDKDNLVS